jgi:hypothetical protein
MRIRWWKGSSADQNAYFATQWKYILRSSLLKKAFSEAYDEDESAAVDEDVCSIRKFVIQNVCLSIVGIRHSISGNNLER